MEQGASAALLQGLVQNLIEHSKNEISRVGRPGKAAKIGESLEMIQKYLNDAEKTDGRDVNIWLKKLEDVAFDANNLMDELTYTSLSKQVKSLKQMKQSAGFSFFNNIVRSLDIATRINKFNKDLESIKKEARRLGLRERPHPDVPALVNATYQADSFSLDPIFIGRDEVVRDIIEILTTVVTTDARISIVAIVGMGGVGKTVLTRKVFDFLKKRTHFQSHIWVHVSHFFDPKSLFKKILKELTSSDQVQVESMEDILERLEEALKEKTYLFILDDIWNEDPGIWDDFINHLLGVTCTKGNAIVVTTRIMPVAVTVNAIHTLPLTGVSDEDCWSIIKAKSCRDKDFPLAFEAIGRKIAARCQGLPLAANVVGGVLRTESKEVWLSIEEKWLPNDEQNHIRDILRSSFDNLYPSSLKKCFAYCSIFPKGRKIESLKLIEYWMAEGFLEVGGSNDTNNCMEHTGEKFINILLQNSLLQVAERDDDGNVTSCVMHDYTHDLANSILSSHNIYGMSRVRYMIYDQGSDGSDPISKEVAKYLRTLFVQGKTFDTMFSDFKCLHNLILSGDNFEELPSAVRKLIHLRNLDISNTKIGNLPEWIGELHHLQTLRACKSHLEKPKLPSTLKNLFNLRHLYIKRNTELPAEIGRLTCLQTLPVFRVGKDNGYQIEELGSLKNLKGKLEIGNLEKVYDRKEALKANIFEKLNLSELVLRWEASREGERNNETVLDEKNNEAVLEGLQPNCNLKRLKIAGFKGKKFPSWIVESGLDTLIEIKLSSCQKCEEIPTLGHLPNLKSLTLKRLTNVRSMKSSFHMTGNSDGVFFPALESIILLNMAELSEWTIESESEVKVFPGLKSLKMYHCYKLECLPNCLFLGTQSLLELDVRHCPKLKALPDGLHALNYLEHMTIRGCRNLEFIANPSGGGSLTSLRSLEIRDCQELTTMVEPSAHLLEKVSMVELKSLQNLPKFLDCLAKSPLLVELTIVAVPEITSSVKIWPFQSLKKLEIDVSRQWSNENGEAIKARVDGILKNCHSSLGELALTGLEIWECLPDSLQLSTALYSLELANVGVEALPECFGKLSSLTRLSLTNCTKLRGLPPMQSLTKLQELRIRDCPKLRINAERHKFSSRTLIFINGHQFG